MNLSSYISSGMVIFPAGKKKQEILSALAETAWKGGKITDLNAFTAAVQARETIMSTGVGLGVAVPHAKMAGIPNFFVTIGILKEPVEWDSIDGRPVSLAFLIGGPDNAQTAYLQILSKIILAIKNEDRRKAIMKASTSEEVVSLFTPL